MTFLRFTFTLLFVSFIAILTYVCSTCILLLYVLLTNMRHKKEIVVTIIVTSIIIIVVAVSERTQSASNCQMSRDSLLSFTKKNKCQSSNFGQN
jgi:hypothetical protein